MHKNGRTYRYSFLVNGRRYSGPTYETTKEAAERVEAKVRESLNLVGGPRIVYCESPKSDVRPKADHSLVYFIGSRAGPIKIGMAADPGRRLSGLQTSSPVDLHLLAVTVGGVAAEKAYHSRFRKHHIRGEWFLPAPEIQAEITRLQPSL